MSKSEVIGEGSYGCVHKPSLLCQNKPQYLNYTNKISKILDKEEADKELKEFINIKDIDPLDNYHNGTPTKCSPLDNKKQRSYIRKCRNSTFKKALKKIDGEIVPLSNNLELLVMKDGGLDLRKFVDKFHNRPVNYNNNKIIQHFFIEFERAFIALRSLEDTDYIHNDLKLDNMVYNVDTNRFNFIDFGLTSKFQSIKHKGSRDDYFLGDQCHWSFPPDIIFINSSTFKSVVTDLKKKKRTIPQVIKKYFYSDSYGRTDDNWASFALSDIYPSYYNSNNMVFINKDRNDQLFETIKYIKQNNQHDFLIKAIYSIDSYGVGMALSNCVHKFKKFLNNDTFEQLVQLCDTMTTWDITKRKNCHELTKDYQNILDRTGILEYNNLQISISDLPTIIPITKREINSKDNIITIPRIRSDAIRPPTPPTHPVPFIDLTKSKTKTKSKSKSKAKSKSKTRKRITDNYSKTDIWKGQELRNRLFSLQGKPEKKGNKNSGKFKNRSLIRAEIRRIEKEKGIAPKHTPTPVPKAKKNNAVTGLIA